MRQRREGLVRAATAAPKHALLIASGLFFLAVSAVAFLGASEDVVQHNGAWRLDGQRLDWFTDHRSKPLVEVARFLNTAGSIAIVSGLAVLVGVWLYRRGLPVLVCAAPLLSVAGAEVVASIVKIAVDRNRPPVSLRLVTENEPSFPSGHATGAAAFGICVAVILTVFVLKSRWSRLVAMGAGLAVPAVVGLSRLELGVHWPTDVAAGLALGACSALTVTGLTLLFAYRDRSPALPEGTQLLRLRRILGYRRNGGPILSAA